MTEQPNHEQHGEDRLPPRPLDKPAVDPALAATFGRPQGVEGAFDKLSAPARGNGHRPLGPPPESLAEAFRRPEGAEGVLLERPAGGNGSAKADPAEAALWSQAANPWRDPGAGAVLGGPAVPAEDEEEKAERKPGAQLSLPEVLFGRRVKPKALALLGVIALLVGAVGGLVGWWFASAGESLTGSANISEAEAAKERPAGSVADIAKRVSPAVVSIQISAPGQDGAFIGSGVVIDPQGYLLTNYHVIAEAVTNKQMVVTVFFTDGRQAIAKVVGGDQRGDLAVIKVDTPNLTVVQVGKSADLAPGDTVLAIGSPLGLQNTVTAGVVSATNRPSIAGGEDGQTPGAYYAIQTDAPINHGNSGGALVDSTGALVGINSSIKTGQSDGSIGLGFAIPSDRAVKVAKALIKGETIKHAEIGINVASVVGSTSTGARVQNLAPDGPGAKAGIREGDVIIKVADHPVRAALDFLAGVDDKAPGEVVPVQLVRDKAVLTVDVTLGSA
ncbi:serine protease, S1-C subfamily, contains C-terminal PDZ domain [Amycolatopsis xylanica]|uniref:Serine protease, S1-C subfamily, contains C-terminal PDZ domain n=1 Tax=Amycolatopsis xylanica TaxID=589385 RepID=A0A1H3T9N2_9PSEU|nr:trypsin-like peptidase domain-containing protein [Amycolatopsis xylanica]SDZ46946.1 serine protease, S1-C subfamily, contains C-terminal PDZ domain [Amycolatopsis xylanica]